MNTDVIDVLKPSEESILRQNRIDSVEHRKQDDLDEQREKREKNSPYQSFVQLNMDKQIMASVSKMARNAAAMRIFLFLTQYMDGLNAVVASYKTMEEALDLSKPTITRGIKYLTDNHFIYVMKSGTSNVYTVNPDIVWKSYGRNKQYCQFPATVILSKSEQSEVKESKVKTVTVKE